MKNAIVNLLKVKSIITLMVIGVTCHLALTNAIDLTVFMSIASSIVTYYFTRKENDKDNEDNIIYKQIK